MSKRLVFFLKKGKGTVSVCVCVGGSGKCSCRSSRDSARARLYGVKRG